MLLQAEGNFFATYTQLSFALRLFKMRLDELIGKKDVRNWMTLHFGTKQGMLKIH